MFCFFLLLIYLLNSTTVSIFCWDIFIYGHIYIWLTISTFIVSRKKEKQQRNCRYSRAVTHPVSQPYCSTLPICPMLSLYYLSQMVCYYLITCYPTPCEQIITIIMCVCVSDGMLLSAHICVSMLLSAHMLSHPVCVCLRCWGPSLLVPVPSCPPVPPGEAGQLCGRGPRGWDNPGVGILLHHHPHPADRWVRGHSEGSRNNNKNKKGIGPLWQLSGHLGSIVVPKRWLGGGGQRQ